YGGHPGAHCGRNFQRVPPRIYRQLRAVTQSAFGAGKRRAVTHLDITIGRTTNRKERGPNAKSSAGLRARLSDLNLAAAEELNFAEWLRLQGTLPWVQFHDEGDALWLFAGDTWPRNNVALARFTPETAHRRVGEIL